MAAPATPEVATDVNFSNAETGRMPTPNKLNLLLERAVIQPGAIANKPSTSGVATGDYLLVQKADGKLYKCPGTSIGGGAQGPKGDPGPPGATGPQGPIGATGQGYTWRGTWSASTQYHPYDTVVQAGSSYVALVTSTGSLPTASSDWELMARIGVQGPTGPTGADSTVPGPKGDKGDKGDTGATGPTGAASTVPGPPGATGPQGSTGPQGPQGTTGSQGPTGSTGPQGPQGPTGPQGATGPQGPAGPSGAPIADTTQDGLLRKVSGVVTDYVGGDNHCHPLPLVSGTQHSYEYDDFTVYYPSVATPPLKTKLCTIDTSGGAGNAVSINTTTDYGDGHVGVANLIAGTVANAWARCFAGVTRIRNHTLTFRALVQLPPSATVGETIQYAVRISNNTTSFAGTDYEASLFAIWAASGAVWVARTRSGAANSDVGTGVLIATNTWYDVKIVLTATAANFYINGNLVATITTNLPPITQPLYPVVFINNSTNTVGRTLAIDLVELDIDMGVPGRFFPPLN
jgi:Collagen triple helix repeat (20 copies)/Concanavalin A-like lectin/glucanases superfamily